jgi:hypothetical protein
MIYNMNNDMKNVKEKKTPKWHCIHEIETWNIEQGEQDYVARLYFIMMLVELKVSCTTFVYNVYLGSFIVFTKASIKTKMPRKHS